MAMWKILADPRPLQISCELNLIEPNGARCIQKNVCYGLESPDEDDTQLAELVAQKYVPPLEFNNSQGKCGSFSGSFHYSCAIPKSMIICLLKINAT